MVENKNLILAIALSVGILLGFEYIYGLLYPEPDVDPGRPGQQTSEGVTPGMPEGGPEGTGEAAPGQAVPGPAASTPPTVPAAGGSGQVPGSTAQDGKAALADSPRVPIDTPSVDGSVSLIGGRLDDLKLKDYHVTVDPQSPEITLLKPPQMRGTYFAEVGWGTADAAVDLPGADALWTTDDELLTPGSPVTLRWTNDQGLTFERTISVDDNYMFTVTQSVRNTGDQTLTLYPYSLVSRHGTPETAGFYILHEGPLGVFDGTLTELDYEDLREQSVIQETTTGGWIGITDKYWLAALVPPQDTPVQGRFVHHRSDGTDIYQTDFMGDAMTVAPGETVDWTTHVFAGAKVARLLDNYAEKYGIPRFDRAIDFGWFYFLTKPIFYFLIYIQDYVGNFGIAILVLTVAIKLVFFPLANKSYKAMSQMRRLQPEMLKLRERFGDDKMRLNQEMMALYKREKVSPASGCLPMVIQIPVFFALYKVLFVTIEMRHAPFYGWINDLSAPDPTSIFNAFGLIPWDPPQFLMIGLWPLIMGITMFLQQKLNPQPPDPLQAKIFMALPVVFTFMLAHFPAGLVIYWTWNNVLSILQQWVIMRRAGVAGGKSVKAPAE